MRRIPRNISKNQKHSAPTNTRYYSIFGKIDTIYCDIAQVDQTEIAITNSKLFLEKGNHLLLVVKSRSIDVIKNPQRVFEEEAEKLRKEGFFIEQIINLIPFDKDHALIDAKF